MFPTVAIPHTGAQVFFVRHGEVHNPQGIFYGRLPRFGLSARGQQQAKAAAMVLAQYPLAAIYTSPLLRARQTGAVLRQEHQALPLQQRRDLLEIRTHLQGRSTALLDTTDWNFYEPQLHPDDETIAEIVQRIERFCRFVARRHPGAAVAAVTHGDLLAIAQARFNQWPLVLTSLRGEHYPATASILRVTYTAKLQATDVSYRSPWAAGDQ